MATRSAVTFAFVAFAFGIASSSKVPGAQARGSDELRSISEDIRFAVGTDGVATVRHHLRYRVGATRVKAFDVTGLDPRGEGVTASGVYPEKGGEVQVVATQNAPGSLHVNVDEPRGLARGEFVVDVSYALDLVSTKTLTRDGAMWRLAWTAPPAAEGHDGARVVFELPVSPTEPQADSLEHAETTLATLRRTPSKDELELVRAHVPRGESVVWAARVDPKAFPRVLSADLRTPLALTVAPPLAANRVPDVLVAFAFAAFAGALAFALRAKVGFVTRGCEAHAARPRPLVPLRLFPLRFFPLRLLPLRDCADLRPWAYGASSAGSLGVLLWGTPAYGALLVVVAMALAAYRSPVPIAKPRGPGRWRVVADAEVFASRRTAAEPGDALDGGTSAGKKVILGIAFLLTAITLLLRTHVAGIVMAVPLVASVLVPLFVTGTRAQWPRTPGELAASVLAPVRDKLSTLVDLTHAKVHCLARFREGTSSFDEVRLACAPVDSIPGLRAIELALTSLEPGAPAALPEVLVRFDDGSEAASKIALLAPGLRLVPGRSPEEKVLRLTPRAPTSFEAARLLARLVRGLEGKRRSDRVASARAARAASRCSDRRVPPRRLLRDITTRLDHGL